MHPQRRGFRGVLTPQWHSPVQHLCACERIAHTAMELSRQEDDECLAEQQTLLEASRHSAPLTMEEQPWRLGKALGMVVTWRRPSHGCRSQLKAGNHDSSTRRKSSSKYICVRSTRDQCTSVFPRKSFFPVCQAQSALNVIGGLLTCAFRHKTPRRGRAVLKSYDVSIP